MSLTEDIAAHACGLKHAALPDAAVVAALTFTYDTLAVGAAGAGSPLAEPVLSVARRWGQGDGAMVLGTGERLPPASAAFVNGFLIHCQEYDCVHEAAVVHPMATVLAALLAEAEARPVPGTDFLAGIVAAVDVAAGLGVAAPNPLRFFRPATAGVFGATAGIARLRGWAPDRLLSAWGLALAQAAGTMQAHAEGKPALPVQIANAARAAHVACDLAEAGVEGPRDALAGPFGYLSLFEEDADLARGFGAMGEAFRITEVSHKAYPTGRAAQGGLLALERLMDRGLTSDGLDALVLAAPPIIPRLVGRAAEAGAPASQARLCFAYLAARMLTNGRVGLDDFTDAALSDEAVLHLAARVRVEDRGGAANAFAPQTLTATLRDGRTLSETIDALPGSPDAPLTRQQQDEKAARCLAYGAPGADAAALRAAVFALPEARDAGAVAPYAVRTS